jgi:putative ABC transport system substrate-binding protein
MHRLIGLFFILFIHPIMAKPLIYIVQHQPLPEYALAVASIKQHLNNDYTLKTVTINMASASDIAQQIQAQRPQLIISVGTKATKLTQSKINRIPIVFTMAFQPQKTGLVNNLQFPGGNTTGVALDIPLDLQFKTLRTIFPYLRRIGTLYTPYRNQEIIDRATIMAQNYQFTLLSKPVHTKDQIQPQLEALFRDQIQLLWSTPDQTIYSKTSLPYILLSLNRFKVPYIGLSKSYLNMGAYVSLDADPAHIGKKTAKMVHQIIQKRQRPMITPVAFPDTLRYAINQTVMTQFEFNVPDNVLKNGEIIQP